MNKLQQEMETEKNKLQKELDQMVSVTLILNNYFFFWNNSGRQRGRLGLESRRPGSKSAVIISLAIRSSFFQR